MTSETWSGVQPWDRLGGAEVYFLQLGKMVGGRNLINLTFLRCFDNHESMNNLNIINI